MEFLLQIVLILACLFYGARKGGLALGLLGGVGIVVLTFAFKLPAGKPPVDVMLTIVAVVAASATLQASGGLNVLLQLAEKILRRNPKWVSILAPFTTCILTMLCGTGHVVYTMLPIIYDVAIKNGIRPERPMAGASIASQMGIMASPVSVAVVSLVAFLAKAPAGSKAIDFVTLLSITIPSTLVGVLMIGIFSWFRGKDLDKDETFQKLIADPEKHKYVYGESATLLGQKLSRSQWTAMWIFVGAIVVVALLGAIESIRPHVAGKPMSMVLTIQMFMLMAGALIIVFTKTNPGRCRQERGVPRRHDSGSRRVRCGVDGRHRVRGEHAGDQGCVGGRREDQAVDLRDRVIDRVQARQLTGGRDRRDGAVGAFDRRSDGPRGRLRGRRLRLLHPADVPVRPRDDPVRPFRHDRDRQVRHQSQLHPAGIDRREQFLHRRLPVGGCSGTALK